MNHSRFLSGLPGFKRWAGGGGGNPGPGPPPRWDSQVESWEVNRASPARSSSPAPFRSGGKNDWKSPPATPRQTNVSTPASFLITLEDTSRGSVQFNPFRATPYGSPPPNEPPHRADFPAGMQSGIKPYQTRYKHALC